MQIGVRALFLFALVLAASAAAAADPEYRLITNPAESAQEAARQLLRHLAAGDIEAAAQLSSTPARRLEVLRDYRDAVGEEEFKRVYARYFSPGNRVMAEAAIGNRRLVIWQLGEANDYLAGQYFVEVDGRFVLDDEPNPERAKLQRVLAEYRRRGAQ